MKSVSFEVKQSQGFGLLGPNGAGKTTTLSIMTAEERPSWGKVSEGGPWMLDGFYLLIHLLSLKVLLYLAFS